MRSLIVKTLLSSLVLSVFFSGCAEVQNALNQINEITKKFTASKYDQVDQDVLMVILDASGSMNEVDRSGVKKIDGAREVITDVANQLDSNKTTLGLVSFNNGCNSTALYARPGNKDFQKVVNLANRINPNGKTPLAKAINGTGGVLKYVKQKARIIVVSDGEESCGGNPIAEAQKLYRTYGTKLEMYVIGYGVDSRTKNQLTQLALAGNGKYFDASDKSNLINIINSIADDMDIKSSNWKGNVFNFKINFDSGSSVLKQEYFEQVASLANYLKSTGYSAQLQGHTDSQGGASANKRLSQKRAQSVVNKLKEYGVSSNKIYATGFGESKPIYSNNTKEGRFNNRRVEAHISKTGFSSAVTTTATKTVTKKATTNSNTRRFVISDCEPESCYSNDQGGLDGYFEVTKILDGKGKLGDNILVGLTFNGTLFKKFNPLWRANSKVIIEAIPSKKEYGYWKVVSVKKY